MLVIVILPVLFAPIIPVEVTTTETRTRKLLSYYKTQSIDDDSSFPDYVNITNYDTVGGTYTVTMNKSSVPPDYSGPPFGGPYYFNPFEDTTTQSMFIGSRNSGIFYAPDNWSYFTYEVTIPTKQEHYNVTKTEYRSIITLFT